MIVSDKLRKSAGHPEAYCTLQIANVCPDNTTDKTAGCMLCHFRIPGDVGGAQKPDDLTAGFGCGPCHRALDANGCAPLPYEDWLFYVVRSMARTLRWWHKHGFLSIKGDKQ